MLDFSNLKQGAVAALFSIVLTVTAVSAAVGPARIAETAPVQVAHGEIEAATHA